MSVPLTVNAVQARHDGRRHPGGRRAETLGYLVRGGRTIYFAGDTELFEEMAEYFERRRGSEPAERVSDRASEPVERAGNRTSEPEGLRRVRARRGARAGLGLGAEARCPGHMDPLQAARAVALPAPRLGNSDSLGHALALGRRASSPRPAARSPAPVRSARRAAGARRGGARPGAGPGDDSDRPVSAVTRPALTASDRAR